MSSQTLTAILFVAVVLITWLYSRHMAAKVDPLARKLEAQYNDARRTEVDR